MNATITPVALARELENAFHAFDREASVPPQMIYNYLKKNVRNLATRAKIETTMNSKGERNSYRFTREVADEFIAEMVSARKNRIATRRNKNQKQDQKKLQNAVRG